MDTGAQAGRPAYELRFQSASTSLDSVAQLAAAARLITHARVSGPGSGMVVVGGERVLQARRVGLLATSMNPLTRAHVALADAAREAARLDVLCWVATVVTVDKERVERATLADRLIEGRMYARVAGDGLLLLMGGLYVEQARAARALLAPDAEITLIVGFDKIVQIFDPRYYDNRDAALRELFDEAKIVVAPREGATEPDLHELLDRPENRPFAEHVRFCPLPERYIGDSSTEARRLAAAGEYGQPLRDLLTPEGLALALAGRPYEETLSAGEADLGDTYTARQMLLAAVSDMPFASLAELPGLERLVAWSAEESVRGAALRAWARQPAPHSLAGLRAAVAAR